MSVDAISTLEISVPYGSRVTIEERLTKYAEELTGLPGCVFYGITRSAKDSRQWVLTGHWQSQNQMVQHFAAVDIHKLIEILEFPSVGIRFGSFSKVDYAEANHEFR
ncbi:antibiotic biosynthesis monooxygenase [Pseudomonas putida]|nr:antibiotic biosynthesis monooxygenase [Pseudomonas putida]